MIIETSFEQHDPEWFNARLDSIGGTGVGKIITSKGERSKQRDDYLTEKASQTITRKVKPVYSTYEMQWGTDHEPEAREAFSFIKDLEVKECAMIFNDEKRNWHISPDFHNDDFKFGGEIKCPQLKAYRKYTDSGILPTEHKLQVQSGLAITGYELWYYIVYFPSLKPMILEIGRDEDLIKIIKAEVKIFLRDLNTLIERLRS